MARSSRKPRFEPDWENGFVWHKVRFPDLENRTPYTVLPTTVFDAVRKTYHEVPFRVSHHTWFAYFRKLPPEIRRMIWNLSLPDARVVPIFYDVSTQITRSDCPIPHQLHVNREARDVALEHYELAFGTGPNPPNVFFDFSKDEIYLGVGNIHRGVSIEFLLEINRSPLQSRKIQKITMDEMLDTHFMFFDDRWESVLGEARNRLMDMPAFQGLRLITLVRHRGDSDAFLAEVDRNPGEVQSWSICPEGRATYFRPASCPRNWYWQRQFSEIWENMETLQPFRMGDFAMVYGGDISDGTTISGMSETTDTNGPVHHSEEADSLDPSEDMETLALGDMGEDMDKKKMTSTSLKPIPTARIVSLSRLARNNPAWQARQNFLQGKTYVYKIPCLVSEHVADPLWLFTELQLEFPELYWWLEGYLNRLLGGQRQGSLDDVIMVLCSRIMKTPGVCLCPTKHPQNDYLFSIEQALAPEGSDFQRILDGMLASVRSFVHWFFNNRNLRVAFLERWLPRLPAYRSRVLSSGEPAVLLGTEVVAYYLMGKISYEPLLSSWY